MKQKVLIFTITLLLGVLFVTPSAFAEMNDNNGEHAGNDEGTKSDCSKHPGNPNCAISVPEFSFIPGAIAAITSAGSILLLRRKIA